MVSRAAGHSAQYDDLVDALAEQTCVSILLGCRPLVSRRWGCSGGAAKSGLRRDGPGIAAAESCEDEVEGAPSGGLQRGLLEGRDNTTLLERSGADFGCAESRALARHASVESLWTLCVRVDGRSRAIG